MPTRENPYSAFNFIVNLKDAGNDGTDVMLGGFSDVSGLGVEVSYADYRNGNEQLNTVRKVPNSHTVDDITLKRGLVGSKNLFNWLQGVREGEANPQPVEIVVLDEARREVMKYTLHRAQPKKYTGPTLAAKGGGEVAMEELTLVCEGIKYEEL